MSTRPDGRAAALAEGRRSDTARRRQRVLAALAEAAAGRAEISVSGIARHAGVDRTFLYRHRDLLGKLHELEVQLSASPDASLIVTRASLESDLHAAQHRAARLAARVQHLERRLSELLGERTWHDSGLGAPDDIDRLHQRIASLEAQVADLRIHLRVDPRGAATPFATLAADWLVSNPAKRPAALARDETIVRVHLEPKLGRRPVGTITPREVQALVNQWCRSLSARTVRRQYGVLRAILNAAVATDVISRSPCRGINLPSPAAKTAHIVDAADLVALAEAMHEAYRPMPYLGAVLGLRWGECAGLRVGRLDFFRSTITVAEQRTRGPGGVMVEGPPKSDAGRRTLTVPVALMEMLGRHLTRQGLTGADVGAYVFRTRSGSPLDYSGWRRRVWLPACHAAGLAGLRFHNLRDANATGLVAEGVDLKTAQARLGHSDPRLTLAIYAQATTDADRSAAERLGSRFMDLTSDVKSSECGMDVG